MSLQASRALESWIGGFLAAERLPADYRGIVEQVHIPLAERIAAQRAGAPEKCLTVGLCGPQGSGKSTMTAVLKTLLEARGLKVAAVSIDDFYLTREAREALGKRVHPLLRTRGVPGTHDIGLATELFAALRAGRDAALPSFDKARDDRRPRDEWQNVAGPVQVILFEGWCVGAAAQPGEALVGPLNSLERDEDAGGRWRRYVNGVLACEYQQLFRQIDFLVLLHAPGFESVYRWRLEQEKKLRERVAAGDGDPSRLMGDADLARFINHYERLTRHILEEMPHRADAVIRLDRERKPVI